MAPAYREKGRSFRACARTRGAVCTHTKVTLIIVSGSVVRDGAKNYINAEVELGGGRASWADVAGNWKSRAGAGPRSHRRRERPSVGASPGEGRRCEERERSNTHAHTSWDCGGWAGGAAALAPAAPGGDRVGRAR